MGGRIFMTLVDRISQIAKDKGLTFRAIERELGLGNGTIKRWEVQSPRLDRLIKVAEYLQVSLDTLVFGDNKTDNNLEDETYFNIKNLKYKQKLIYDDSPLTEEEADLIAMFRPLPFREREDIFELVYFKYKKCVKKKTKSIY